MKQVEREITALQALNHVNVLRMIDVFYEAKWPNERNPKKKKDVLLIVLELAEGGELFDFLKFTGAFDESVARTFFHQLVDGLKSCHENGIAHRDLKPDNLLLDSQFTLKIADFGLAHMSSGEKRHVMNTECGTRGYMAPEILEGQGYGYEADIFAAGVILFIMLAGFPPFQFATRQDWWFSKLQEGKHALFWKAHCRQATFSEEAKDFINRILEPDPTQRITIDQILEHEWFTANVLSDSQLREELGNRKRALQKQKKKEREALARKSARGDGRVRGANRPEDRDRSILLMGEDDLPVSAPEMDFSGAFLAGDALNVDMGMASILSPRRVEDAPVYDEKASIECYTSFNSLMRPTEMVEYLTDVLRSASVKYQKPNQFEIRANIMTQENGVIDFVARIYATPNEESNTLVQFRRIKGDVLKFHNIFEELLVEIAEVVYLPAAVDDEEFDQ